MHGTRFGGVSQVHAEAKPVFQVVIVYEDFAAGGRANETCGFLMAQLGNDFELRSSMWKFEILRNPKLAEIAAAEAVQANVIIVAAHGSLPLPSEVRNWIELWVPLRERHPAALIALLDGNAVSGESASPVYVRLQKVARAANMEFLPCFVAFSGHDLPRLVSWLKSASESGRTDELPPRPPPDRHWGINE